MKLRFGIDVGNTNTKVFVLPDAPPPADRADLLSWSQSQLHVSVPFAFRDVAMAASHVDIVSVDPLRSAAIADEVQKGGAKVRHWTSATLPLKNTYADDTTLGPDRPLAAWAAWYEFQAPVIVIDAGTALTVDLIDSHGTFVGGSIAPGLGTLADSLGQAGAMLHEVEPESLPFPGESTTDCLKIGVYEMFAGGLRRLVEAARCVEPEARVVVTGGGGKTSASLLNDLKPEIRPLLRIGLGLLSWKEEV